MLRPAIALSQPNLAAIGRSGVRVPAYDRGRLAPRIVHIGVGGFHRAHMAAFTDHVAATGGDWGIVGVGLREADAAMASVLGAQDHLYTLIERGPGAPVVSVVGSLVGYVYAPGAGRAFAELVAAPETAILSLTITEAGYGPAGADGPTQPDTPSTFDHVAAALRLRRDRGAGGLTVLSCDNLSGNGAVTRSATLAAARRAGEDLAAWVEERCSFPSSTVDRITPATTDADREWLREAHGIEDGWPVVTEPFRQWVLEDDFVAGRPAWERDGAIFSDRVHDWEQYKLRLLNAGHSCIAYLATLAGLEHVDEALATPALRAFLEVFLLDEALPTVRAIPGHPPERYVASVLERFANPGVRDQLARLCQDGSTKLALFVVPTLVAQLERDGPVEHAAAALAAWARYLGATEPARQAPDAGGRAARAHAAAALQDPRAFLAYPEVFPAAVRESERFGAAFADAYRRIAEEGPLALAADALRP